MRKLYFLFIISIFFSQDFDDLNFGTDSSLDVITWNIEWFPKNGQTTVDYVSEIILALDADIIAMQELSDTVLFNQMINNLEGYHGYYESSWFAGLAYIYKSETIEINNIFEIYTTSQYWSPFPRSPMVMDMSFMNENYLIINNHFKCCGDDVLDSNNDNDEEMRRFIASSLLKEYIDSYYPDSRVIVLGDLNDSLTDAWNNNVFQMFLDDQNNFMFTDMQIAEGNVSSWSFPNWPSHIDHILITNELFEMFENNNSYCETILIDEFMDGGFYDYDQNISDHRPVGLHLFAQPTISGDLNGDEQVDVLDVIIVVNIILDDESPDFMADLNNDGMINVVDVLLIVNLILGN